MAELAGLAGELLRVALVADGLDRVRARALDGEGARAHLLTGLAPHRARLAGQDRLVQLQPGRVGERAVGHDLVARLHAHEVAGNHLPDGDVAWLAVADDGGLGRDQRSQAVERALRAQLLRDPDRGVGHDDEEEERVPPVCEDERQQPERGEDRVERRQHVRPDDRGGRAAGRGRRRRSPLREPTRRLSLGQSAHGQASEATPDNLPLLVADFAKTIAEGYAVKGGVDRPRPRRARREGRRRGGRPAPAEDDEPSRPGRRRDRHGQDPDPAADRRAALRARRPRVRRRLQGRSLRAARAGLGGRPGGRADDRPRAPARADGLPGRVPLARRDRSGRSGARHGDRLRPAAPGEDPRLERHPGGEPRTGLPLCGRARAAARRPRGPAGGADLSRLGRGQGRSEGARRGLGRDDRRSAPLAGRARGRRRHGVLRRAAVRDRRPACGRHPRARA